MNYSSPNFTSCSDKRTSVGNSSPIFFFSNDIERFNNKIKIKNEVANKLISWNGLKSLGVCSIKCDKMPKYTRYDISFHNKYNDCWTIIDNNVYNITEFISLHPGGDEILKCAGCDGTELFKGSDDVPLHTQAAFDMLKKFFIGVVDED